eukprot:TRINITY_DN10854_c0_g3_i2.p2 TRINITY_DN10854_c0_g3~~TRINITY_DN10854_c0_g3_i2.p2  ORF type:complete len:100 (+),score=28.36 TRINITY_DN10854_c0_g3_i2:266-565(+)
MAGWTGVEEQMLMSCAEQLDDPEALLLDDTATGAVVAAVVSGAIVPESDGFDAVGFVAACVRLVEASDEYLSDPEEYKEDFESYATAKAWLTGFNCVYR